MSIATAHFWATINETLFRILSVNISLVPRPGDDIHIAPELQEGKCPEAIRAYFAEQNPQNLWVVERLLYSYSKDFFDRKASEDVNIYLIPKESHDATENQE